ncbi:MAG: hypothetical protein ACTSR8_06135 [Promethearchaeota archaeon]
MILNKGLFKLKEPAKYTILLMRYFFKFTFFFIIMDSIFTHIEQLALIPSIHPDEALVRKYIIQQLDILGKNYDIDELGNVYIKPKEPSVYLLSAHMDKQAEPFYKDDIEFIEGKLDDAVGLGVILALAESYEFHALLTIGEEVGSIGAIYAYNNGIIPCAQYCIVIDTSPKGVSEQGPVLYSGFLGKVPYDFVSIIKSTAKTLNINVQFLPSGSNDGEIIIRQIPNTIALESHIENYHTSREYTAKQDIVDIYNILEKLLKD